MQGKVGNEQAILYLVLVMDDGSIIFDADDEMEYQGPWPLRPQDLQKLVRRF